MLHFPPFPPSHSSDPARISNKSDTLVATPGDSAELWCQLDGQPLLPEHVTWRRPHANSLDGTVMKKKKNLYLTN